MGGGITLLEVFTQTLGTFVTVVLLVQPDAKEPLPSFAECKSVLGRAACGCGAQYVKLGQHEGDNCRYCNGG